MAEVEPWNSFFEDLESTFDYEGGPWVELFSSITLVPMKSVRHEGKCEQKLHQVSTNITLTERSLDTETPSASQMRLGAFTIKNIVSILYFSSCHIVVSVEGFM